ncbi:hypothetical protein AQ505_23635 [Pedobacter sp. PACM 27299]|uniref:DUF1634 domain-containing protein n=1 Tax=Pedobacter sp. PACM 27299 TaxID=1727164 RepID=UPI000706BCD8|nr:DUF1634 domain-containing protein [Pedobacter sp. PACM 27299]ALL08209.1 hypothetical protein AQ505_23635 [Pedobacter sp. PACM 27299]
MSGTGKNFFADRDIQVILGTLLRVGVIASMSVVLVGGFLYLRAYHAAPIDYQTFNPNKSELSSIASVFVGLRELDPKAIIQFGTLLLIFTPVARVVFSIFSFLIERDYLYVLIGSFVLLVIMYSLSDKLVG